MSYDVKINRQGFSALFDLKGEPKALRAWAGKCLPDLPDAPNQLTTSDGASLYHIGRNHWILHAKIEQEDAFSKALKPEAAPAYISIVRISDMLTFFDITGPDAAQILSIACPLDLHPLAFGDTAVTFTEAFGFKALLRRVEGGFEFAVEQSFGNLIADYLARATAA